MSYKTVSASQRQIDYALELQGQSSNFNLFTQEDLKEMDRDRMTVIIEHLQEQRRTVKRTRGEKPKATQSQIDCMLGMTDEFNQSELASMEKSEISHLIQYVKSNKK